MNLGSLSKRTILLTPVLTGLLLPTAVVIGSMLIAGYNGSEIISELGDSLTRRKLNLGITTGFAILPFLLLTLILWLYLRKCEPFRGVFLLVGGIVGAIFVILPAYLLFYPKHYRSGPLGFPHGLELFLGPMAAFVTMGIGVLIGWLVGRSRPPAA